MCDFCNEIAEWKELRKEYDYKGIKDIFKCKLAIETYKGKRFTGTVTSKSYELRFCPMCGRNLATE